MLQLLDKTTPNYILRRQFTIPQIINILFNRAVFLTSITQLFAALAPLLFLRIVFRAHEASEIVQMEVLLAIFAFSATISNWSGNLFLARSYARLLKSGAFTTILINRLILIVILFIVLLIIDGLSATVSLDTRFLMALALMHLGQLIDISWVYIGQKKLYIPQIQIFTQYLFASLMLVNNVDLFVSIAISWVIVPIIFYYPLRRIIRFGSYRKSLSEKFFKIYWKPTLAELSTSLFSKLDVIYASVLLGPNSALLYIVLRKHIVALQGVIFSAVRLQYLERNQKLLEKIGLTIQTYVYLASTIGVGFVYISVTVFFETNLSPLDLIALFILGVGILVAQSKNKLQFQHVYRNRLFSYDLIANFIVFVVYCLGILGLGHFFGITVLYLVALRVMNDVTYILSINVFRSNKW